MPSFQTSRRVRPAAEPIAVDIPPAWSPTSDSINSLPEPLRRPGHDSPSLVPEGFDIDVYVVEDYGQIGRAYREVNEEKGDGTCISEMAGVAASAAYHHDDRKITISARPPTVKPLDESGSYLLVFSGANGEELAQYHVRRLSDAILRTRQLEQTPIGAVAERASIYSADGKLFWSRSFGQQQKKVMQVNAQRILLQLTK